MAEALLIRMSMPPNFSAAFCTHSCTFFSSLTSRRTGRAFPPACKISSAAENMVPARFGLGMIVLAATTIFAPTLASLSAISFPIPLDAPVMRAVRPANDMRNYRD
ncbi:hypothetical protein PENTCL1PPCAC_17611 [Pristionchus entomophagus]|uniref:Uncharacterized protein n=1 Tax=Pristionchus entomophagus TaxID=358040 RepID=A0AAV5TM77_9BILA|nr:hypothetical protein PENTCL1PPCAC_17611 [Pristionchus entomophagus]